MSYTTTQVYGATTYAPAFLEIFLLFILLLPLMIIPIVLLKTLVSAVD